MVGSNRQYLLDATKDIHEQLHHADAMVDIMRGNVSSDTVRQMLSYHYACWAFFAKWSYSDVISEIISGQDLNAFFRIEDIEKALIEEGKVARLTKAPGAYHAILDALIPSDAALLGALYVYLGSKNGGGIIGKYLKKAGFPIAAHYLGPGDNDKKNWQHLLVKIEMLDEQGLNEATAVATACFQVFQAGLLGAGLEKKVS